MSKKYCVRISMDDAPHLDEETKKEIIEALLPEDRYPRSKGVPVGSKL